MIISELAESINLINIIIIKNVDSYIIKSRSSLR